MSEGGRGCAAPAGSGSADVPAAPAAGADDGCEATAAGNADGGMVERAVVARKETDGSTGSWWCASAAVGKVESATGRGRPQVAEQEARH